MRIRSSVLAVCIGVLGLVIARPAFAQDDMRGDFGVGYAAMHDSDLQTTFPSGFLMALAGDMNKSMRIAAEFGGNYKYVEVTGVGRFRLQVTTYLGGLRVASSKKSTLRPFGQFLAGGARLSTTQAGVVGVTSGDNGFAIQPGGGVDMRLNSLMDGRVQVDYRWIHSGGDHLSEMRYSFSVVFPFGRD